MTKLKTTFIALLSGTVMSMAQTTAMDFTMNDCNGQMYNLFTELNMEHAVIMEFFHTCPSCAAAANDIKPMYQSLVAQYGNKVRFIVTPEDDTYNCTSVVNWVSTNGLSGVVTPFDSGGVQTAYYGGLGMPTIAVAAGSTHKLLYLANAATASFATSDTGLIGTAIRNFLDSTFAGIGSIDMNISAVVYPNPVGNNLSVSIEVKEPGTLQLEITNVTGDKVAELTEEQIQSGIWKRSFPVSLSNGTYFINGSINENAFSKKITVKN